MMRYCLVFLLAILIAILTRATLAQGRFTAAETNRPGALVADARKNGDENAPLFALPQVVRADLDRVLVYSSRDFTLPLLQPLFYETNCDCYTLMVLSQAGSAYRALHFWRAPSGFYRTGNGPYAELEDSSSLKTITDLSNTRYLFAQLANGEWRCAAIHDSLGHYLLIDYNADGSIVRLRDSRTRTAVPAYSDGRIVSITQMWTVQTVTRVQISLVDMSGYH
jgi:hypothetical protein